MVILDCPIIPFDCIEKMMEKIKCMCKIKMVQESTLEKGNKYGTGSGFFAYIRHQDQKYPVLITCDFILKKENLNEINLKVGNDNEYINIKVNDNRIIYSKEMEYSCGITIIEIIPEKDEIVNFYEFDDFIYVEKRNIYIPQYVKNENKLSISYGRIKEFDDDTIIHLCSTDFGSGGAPIINIETNKVIGIHAGSFSEKNYNFGYLLKNVIAEYINIKKNYKESDFNNLKLLSSGAYGNIFSAYSIKDKKEVCLKKINLEKMKLNYQMNELNDYKRDINNEIKILQTLNFNTN